MAAFVKAHHNPLLLNLDYASGFHEFAIQLFRRSGFKTMELLGQPAVAAVGQNGQRSIQIDIEPHFTGQTIEVKEVDADTECVRRSARSASVHSLWGCWTKTVSAARALNPLPPLGAPHRRNLVIAQSRQHSGCVDGDDVLCRSRRVAIGYTNPQSMKY
jgi:hypothetical protein